MAQIPQRNLLNLKLNSTKGIQAKQTYKIDFLSYNDLYNYAMNGAAKDFKEKYTDVAFKAGCQEAINVATLHKSDFMTTSKESLLEELHTELLKTAQAQVKQAQVKSTPKKTPQSMFLNGNTQRTSPTLANTIISNRINLNTSGIIAQRNPAVSNNSTFNVRKQAKTTTVEAITVLSDEKTATIDTWVKNFSEGNLTVTQLITNLKSYGIKYTENTENNYNVVSFKFALNNGKTKTCTVKCNKAASEHAKDSITVKTYTAADLKTYGLDSAKDAKIINKYFDLVQEGLGDNKYALKTQYGSEIEDIISTLRRYNELECYTDNKAKNLNLPEVFQSNSTKQLIGGLLKKYDEKIDKAYEASNADDFHDLEEDALKVFLDKFHSKDIDLQKVLDNESVVGYRCVDRKYISGPYSELIGVTLVWRDQLYTLIKTSMPSTSKLTVHDSTDIDGNPTKKDEDIKHVVSVPSSRFSSLHIAEAFNGKESINDFVKNYVKYELGYTDCNEKVLEKFITELKQANKTYDLSKCTKKELKEIFESYYNSVNNTAMKTTSEMLVKAYNAKDFLKNFAKENYYIEKDVTFLSLDSSSSPRTVRMYDPTTAQNNALNDLVSSIKLEYTRKTGKDCEYSDEDIKKFIKAALDPTNYTKLDRISAYDIIEKITALLQETDLLANEITTDSIKDLSNGLENALEEYAKICIEAQNYVTTQLKNNSPISFDDYLKYIKSKYPKYNSNEYDEDLKGTLALGITQRLRKAGATNDDILEILEALFKEPSKETDSSNSYSRSAAHAKERNNIIVTPSIITPSGVSSFTHWWLGVEDKNATGIESVQEMIDTLSYIGDISNSDDGWITTRRFIAGICPYVSQLGGWATLVKSAEELYNNENRTFGDCAIFTVDALLNVVGWGKTAKKGLKLLSTKSKILEEILDAMEKNLEPNTEKILEWMGKVHDLVAVNTWNKIKDSLITKIPRTHSQGNDVPVDSNSSDIVMSTSGSLYHFYEWLNSLEEKEDVHIIDSKECYVYDRLDSIYIKFSNGYKFHWRLTDK